MKRLLFLIIVIVLVFSLSSCSAKDNSEKDMNVAFFSMPAYESSIHPNPPKHNSILFDGKRIPLVYTETFRVYHRSYHIYNSSDNNICCYYDATTDRLWQIVVKNVSSYFPFSDCTEESQYIDLVKEVVADYRYENWRNYTYTCETVMHESGENWSSSVPYSGFLKPSKDNESVFSYSFNFTRYISGFPTSDIISASYSPESHRFSIKFSEHAFDFVNRISVNSSDIENSIDAFVQQNIDASKYPELEYSIYYPTLIMIDKKIYYHCYLDHTGCLIPIIVEI